MTRWLAFCLMLFAGLAAAQDEALTFDDHPLEDALEYPDWFKQSFLDLRDDLDEMNQAQKKALVVYFGQRHCAYCRALMEINFRMPDIVAYMEDNFDLVPMNIWGINEVTDLEGKVTTEREFAIRENTNFTPSLLFYNSEGQVALRLRGYYPPYKFRAALTYVAEGWYLEEKFSDYLARAEPAKSFEPDGMSEEDFFQDPPFNLARNKYPAERPLMVIFEQGNCHACDILHTDPLEDLEVLELVEQMDAVQLSIWSNEPVITPAGKRTTARDWAREMGLFYTPSLIFFDQNGNEIIRVASVVRFYRLRNVLRYVLSEGYKKYPTFQAWRMRNVDE